MRVFYNQVYPLNPFLVSRKEDIILVPNVSCLQNEYIEAYLDKGMEGTIVRYNMRNIRGILSDLTQFLFTPYILSDSVEAIIQQLGLTTDFSDIHFVRTFENKTVAKELFSKLGCKSLPNLTIEEAQAEGSHFDYLVVKEVSNMGGLGNTKVRKEGLSGFNFRKGVKYVIEPFIEGDSFCSLYLLGDSIDIIGTTRQIIQDDFYYGGNIFPVPNAEQIQSEADKVAHGLHKMGYRGWLGIDSKQSEGIYLLEINPRLNGSTFPMIRQRELGYSSMACSLASVERLPTLKEFEKAVAGNGEVIPYNIGFGFNSVGFVMFGDESLETKALSLKAKFK